jgi:hypothetical protein
MTAAAEADQKLTANSAQNDSEPIQSGRDDGSRAPAGWVALLRTKKHWQLQAGLMDRGAAGRPNGSVVRVADVLSVLDKRLEVLHVLQRLLAK